MATEKNVLIHNIEELRPEIHNQLICDKGSRKKKRGMSAVSHILCLTMYPVHTGIARC